MINDTPAGPPADAHLSQEAVLALLRTGRTYAAEVLGDPHPRYLEALAEGLAAGAEVAVVGDTNRAPRALADRGAVVRVAPLPPLVKDSWRIYVFQGDGVFGLSGIGSALAGRGWRPQPADWRTGVAEFGLLAPFDGKSVAASWDAHPERLRAEYLATVRDAEPLAFRSSAEVRRLPRIRLVQSVTALVSGVATSYVFLQNQPAVYGLIALGSGALCTWCYLTANRTARRIRHFAAFSEERRGYRHL